MRQCYLLLVLLLALGQQAWGQATAWRLFRPRFVYSFAPVGSSTTTVTLHTLRVDSAYATVAGDSVYTFNRLLRQPTGSSYQYCKSRNNLLGARLRWRPGTSGYYLEANAEPAIDGTTTPTVLLLWPRARTGSTWAASTQPALTAVLSSRSVGLVGSLSDSLSVITLSNGQTFTFSKRYGLVQGPQWLALNGSSTNWQQAAAPRPGLGPYDPQTLFALNVGDELGYEVTNYAYGSGQIVCSQSYELSRIIGRQLSADSLVLTYRRQTRTTVSAFASCGTPGPTTSPVLPGRWAVSLETGQSPQFPFLGLLSGEYRANVGTSLLVGRGLAAQPATSSCRTSTQTLAFVPVYPAAGQAGSYTGGLDDAAYVYEFSASLGLGPITLRSSANYSNSLIYYSRNGVACGSRANFATLLLTRAALAAQLATLHPNPATDAATLTLAAPAPAGATLALLNALGRQLWRQPIASGQTTLPISVAGRPTGLYLVQLDLPGQPALIWKLTRD